MKKHISRIEKTGYGHWRVTVTLANGKHISATTTNSMAIDDLKGNDNLTSRQEKKAIKKAIRQLIREVESKNK